MNTRSKFPEAGLHSAIYREIHRDTCKQIKLQVFYRGRETFLRKFPAIVKTHTAPQQPRAYCSILTGRQT
jgi:hypothetical protein